MARNLDDTIRATPEWMNEQLKKHLAQLDPRDAEGRRIAIETCEKVKKLL